MLNWLYNLWRKQPPIVFVPSISREPVYWPDEFSRDVAKVYSRLEPPEPSTVLNSAGEWEQDRSGIE